MASRYELSVGIKHKHDIEKVKEVLRDRTKNLRPLFCKTLHNGIGSSSHARYEVRVRITCSWRTIDKIENFLLHHTFAEQNTTKSLIAWYGKKKLMWTGSRFVVKG